MQQSKQYIASLIALRANIIGINMQAQHSDAAKDNRTGQTEQDRKQNTQQNRSPMQRQMAASSSQRCMLS